MNTLQESGSLDDGYITKLEMAKRFKVTPRTIETWVRQKKVPCERIGRTVRFCWNDVRNYLARQNASAAQPQNPLCPTESTKSRMQELAAEIRRRQPIDQPARVAAKAT